MHSCYQFMLYMNTKYRFNCRPFTVLKGNIDQQRIDLKESEVWLKKKCKFFYVYFNLIYTRSPILSEHPVIESVSNARMKRFTKFCLNPFKTLLKVVFFFLFQSWTEAIIFFQCFIQRSSTMSCVNHCSLVSLTSLAFWLPSVFSHLFFYFASSAFSLYSGFSHLLVHYY